jgi:hypothetical protein
MKYTLNKLSSEISCKSLFVKGGTLSSREVLNILKDNKFKFCTGKYNSNIIEKIQALMLENNCVIWYENKSDQFGKYIQLYTVSNKELNNVLFKILNI